MSYITHTWQDLLQTVSSLRVILKIKYLNISLILYKAVVNSLRNLQISHKVPEYKKEEQFLEDKMQTFGVIS